MSETFSSYKKKLQYWGSHTTFHAIPNIATAKNFIVQLIWSILLVFFTGACLYVIFGSLIEYYQYDVETVVDTVKDDEGIFPVISFCQMQQCGLSDYKVDSYINNVTWINELKQDPNNNIRLAMLKIKNSYLKDHKKSSLSLTNISEYLISCTFKGETCNENDFVTFYINEFTKCFRYNSGKSYSGSDVNLKKTKESGKINGLQLQVTIGKENNCKSPFSTSSGLLLFVHNQSSQISEDDVGFHLQPGTENEVSISRTLISKLDHPYGGSPYCLLNHEIPDDASDLVRDTFRISTNVTDKIPTYSQKTCLQLCYQTYVVKTHECYNEFLPYNNKGNVVKCSEKLKSYDYVNITEKIGFDRNEIDKCLKECPLECEIMKYDLEISSAQFPSETYKDLLSDLNRFNLIWPTKEVKEHLNDDYTNIIGINAFYSKDSYKRIKDKPALEFSIYISNLGGMYGLFLGGSILSLAELLEIIIECASIYLSKGKNSKNLIKTDKKTLSKKNLTQNIHTVTGNATETLQNSHSNRIHGDNLTPINQSSSKSS